MLRAASLTTAAITGGNTPFVWSFSHIPVIALSTGSIGNNGALTGITALPTTYANAYVIVPAGAIASGVPAAADTYFAQFSSATAATIFNNRLADNLDSKGAPTIPASPTAFATTGPGAFTGIITQVTAVTLTLPASTVSVTGEVYVDAIVQLTNNANAKNIEVDFGATALINAAANSQASAFVFSAVKNRNSASVQSCRTHVLLSGGALTVNNAYGTVNTGASVAIAFKLTHSGAATDNLVLESFAVSVLNN